MTPKFSKNIIDQIGKTLITSGLAEEDREDAIDVFNDWRTQFLYPLNTFQSTLRKYVRSVDPQGIVAQRLKRTPTILDKLKRYPKMRLSQMQDVGGLRAIVADIQSVQILDEKYKRSRTKHKLKTRKDYIAEPKGSGYRGIHLVYENANPKNPDLDGLMIEIQLRTRLQHIWATAVETVGVFFKESLKSSLGSEMWLDFFKLVSAVFALDEKTRPSKEFHNISRHELVDRLRDFVEENTIHSKLMLIHEIKSMTSKSNGHHEGYLLIVSDAHRGTSSVYGFLGTQMENATAMYHALEESPRSQRGEVNVVLVSVEFVKQIEKAYPSFFLNIADFTRELNKIVPDIRSPFKVKASPS